MKHNARKVLDLAIGGVALFVVLTLFAQGTKQSLAPRERQRVRIARAASPFDGKRAYRDLEAIVAMGPRPSGSKALAALRAHIRRELEGAGLSVWEHAFDAATPRGILPMVNLVGVIKGGNPEVIVLGTHYETKYFRDFTFTGANDGGSTTAWMIEMGRAIGAERSGRTLWLCFFDGEEALESWSETDGLYGSRAFVAHLKETDRLSKVKAMINVDMVGDCYLDIDRDADAPAWLTRAVWDKAAGLGYSGYFLQTSHSIEDDHIPFRKAGVAALNIIDFRYGGSAGHRRNWHTANDTLERVCADSLQAVGDVIYHAVVDIDVYLDRTAQN